MNVYSFETFDRSCIECVINLQFQVWTSIIIFLKTHHINSSETWLRNSWRSVRCRWCPNHAAAVVAGGNLWRMFVSGDEKVRDSMAALVWPQPCPALPNHTKQPSPGPGERCRGVTGHQQLAPLPLADCALFTGSHSAAIFTFIEDNHQLSFQN